MNQKEFLDRYNDLTGIFLRKFRNDAGEGNLVYSPFSIISLLAILADATAGAIQQEVLNLMYGDLPHEGFPGQLKAARKELARRNSWLYDDPCHDRPAPGRRDQLCTANAVFVRESLKEFIQPCFEKHLNDTYDGELFSSPDLKTAMRKWSAKGLREMLPLLEEIVKSQHLLAMINTVFFQAMWCSPYGGRNVREGIFHNADHSDSKVTMLYGGGDGYVENEFATGFLKDFQQCNYTFMALLPRKKGPEALCDVINNTDFSALMECPNYRTILHTKMPEFKVSFRTVLNETLKSLGIQEAFTLQADFSPMAAVPLMVDQIIHQAKIEVDRNGARASAATELIFIGAGLPDDEKYVMIDRPFVFAILHKELKIPVFAGVVNHVVS